MAAKNGKMVKSVKMFRRGSVRPGCSARAEGRTPCRKPRNPVRRCCRP